MDHIGKNFLGAFSNSEAEEQSAVETSAAEKNEVENKDVNQEDKKNNPPENTEKDKKDTPENTQQDKPQDTDAPSELSEDQVKEYLKNKYSFDGELTEDVFKPRETSSPTADPLEGYSEEAKAFLKSGRSFDEFLELSKDYSKISPLEIAREKAIKLSNGQLTRKDVDAYLERKLGFEINDPENLEKFEQIELQNYGRDYLDQKIAKQEELKKATPNRVTENEDVVTLENGAKMPKEQYDKLIIERKNYLDSLKASSDNIKEVMFSVDFDNKGEKQNIDVSYDFSKDDKHQMMSSASDIDKTFNEMFRTKDGAIDPVKVQQAMFWINDESRTKAIKTMINKGIAQALEQNLAEENNFEVNTNQHSNDKNQGKKVVQIPGANSTNGLSKFFQ